MSAFMDFWLIVVLAGFAAGTLGTYACLWSAESRRPRLICLMYHRFVTDDEYRRCRGADRIYSLPLARFEQQLDYLRRNGYRSVSLAEAVAFAERRATLPERSVLITIDDGARSVLTRALPRLREHGFCATLFVTTDPTAYVFDASEPEQRRLTDDELRALDPDVIDVQAHGVTHRPLTSLGDDELRRELVDSRAALEHILGRPVRYMAVPGGWYDGRVRRLAREAGYEGVCVSDVGAIRPGTDVMRLRRINVAGYNDLDEFIARIQPASLARIRFKTALRRVPKRLLGPRLWMPIRAVLRGSRSPGQVAARHGS